MDRYNKLGLDTADADVNETVYSFMEVTTPLLTTVSVTNFSLGTHHSAIVTGLFLPMYI